METYSWYQTLAKPSWAPPAELFGPVWTALYILIAISFGFVTYLYLTKKLPFKVFLPFILNLIFNIAFSPLEFGLQSLILGSIDIVLVLTTLIWSLVTVFRYAKWVTFINIPYLLWVSFATILQFAILLANQ